MGEREGTVDLGWISDQRGESEGNSNAFTRFSSESAKDGSFDVSGTGYDTDWFGVSNALELYVEVGT